MAETKKRYILTDETKTIIHEGKEIVLHRIRALQTFNMDEFHSVTYLDEGGWIEKESNLSQTGHAWIGKDAMVFGNAVVSGNAFIYGSAQIYGHAKIKGRARV